MWTDAPGDGYQQLMQVASRSKVRISTSEYPCLKRMKAGMVIFIMGMLCFHGNVFSQNDNGSNYFLKAMRLNSGFTYWENGPEQFHKFHEITWSNQISVSITKGLFVGLQLYSIYTSGSYVRNENFLLSGVFVHYDFIRNHQAMGFIELSYSQGDYCYCGPGDPYRFPDLQYIGFGPGLDYPIRKSNLYAHFSTIFHIIAGEADDKYPFIIYKAGLTYRFGKHKSITLP